MYKPLLLWETGVSLMWKYCSPRAASVGIPPKSLYEFLKKIKTKLRHDPLDVTETWRRFFLKNLLSDLQWGGKGAVHYSWPSRPCFNVQHPHGYGAGCNQEENVILEMSFDDIQCSHTCSWIGFRAPMAPSLAVEMKRDVKNKKTATTWDEPDGLRSQAFPQKWLLKYDFSRDITHSVSPKQTKKSSKNLNPTYIDSEAGTLWSVLASWIKMSRCYIHSSDSGWNKAKQQYTGGK